MLKIKRWGLLLLGTILLQACSTPKKYVLVDKSERKMYVKKGGRTIEEFNIALGQVPVGKKVREGDKKTPEGVYRLGYRNSRSSFYKSIAVSYPNLTDRKRAQSLGVRPGGQIVVHGLPNGRNLAQTTRVSGKDWTDGCIALSNKDMNRFWSLIDKPGTLIKIRP